MDDVVKMGVVISMCQEYGKILKDLNDSLKRIDICKIDSEKITKDPEYVAKILMHLDPKETADVMAKSYLKAAIALSMVQKKVNEAL